MTRNLLALARAAATGRPARLDHLEAGPCLARHEVEVLALGWRWGGWVALTRGRPGGGLRVLELHRVSAVRVLERRRLRRPRAGGRGAPRRPDPAPGAVDPLEFALADLQAPGAGPVRLVTVDLPRALAPLARTLFPGAALEPLPGGARIRLRATDQGALAQMVASLGLALG